MSAEEENAILDNNIKQALTKNRIDIEDDIE